MMTGVEKTRYSKVEMNWKVFVLITRFVKVFMVLALNSVFSIGYFPLLTCYFIQTQKIIVIQRLLK